MGISWSDLRSSQISRKSIDFCKKKMEDFWIFRIPNFEVFGISNFDDPPGCLHRTVTPKCCLPPLGLCVEHGSMAGRIQAPLPLKTSSRLVTHVTRSVHPRNRYETTDASKHLRMREVRARICRKSWILLDFAWFCSILIVFRRILASSEPQNRKKSRSKVCVRPPGLFLSPRRSVLSSFQSISHPKTMRLALEIRF
mgnify:CR=1 FL=1